MMGRDVTTKAPGSGLMTCSKAARFYSNFAVPGSPAEPECIRYMIVIYMVYVRLICGITSW